MARDVSAFANAEGGQIVYGMTERDHEPAGLDSGIDPKSYPEIWFEQVLQQHITPNISGLRVHHVPLSEGRVAVVIDVPATEGDPHQVDGRYYRRHNFNKLAMEHYEVSEMFRRKTTPKLDVQVAFENTHSPTQARLLRRAEWCDPVRLIFRVTNLSNQPAEYAILIAYVDSGFRISDVEIFDFRMRQVEACGVGCTMIAANLGLPGAPPIFREYPEIGGVLNVGLHTRRIGAMNLGLACEIRTPGFVQRQRWPFHSLNEILIIGEPEEWSE